MMQCSKLCFNLMDHVPLLSLIYDDNDHHDEDDDDRVVCVDYSYTVDACTRVGLFHWISSQFYKSGLLPRNNPSTATEQPDEMSNIAM